MSPSLISFGRVDCRMNTITFVSMHNFGASSLSTILQVIHKEGKRYSRSSRTLSSAEKKSNGVVNATPEGRQRGKYHLHLSRSPQSSR